MSLTAIVWLFCFAAFAILAFRRPAWGIALYLLVFYMDPNFWWWGESVASFLGQRLSITAAVIFALALFANGPRLRPVDQKLFVILLLYAANATVIHFLFAANPERSARSLDLIWKDVGLLFLMVAAIRDEVDWKIFIYAIVIGSLYIGYEMVINDRGHFEAGRFERAVASGVSDSNYLAGFLSLAVPLAGAMLLCGSRREKLLALIMLPLVCNTIVLCNSRGGFLALIAGGGWLLFRSKKRFRRYALIGVLLGAVAAVVLVRDQRIVDRFFTAFAPAQERDKSAQSRLNFWMAGVHMVADRPLGSGGEAAFKSHVGVTYLIPFGVYGTKAIHNGYLDVACAWGIQGLALYGWAIWYAWRLLRRAIRHAALRGERKTAFLGLCIEASLIVQLVSAMFISSFDGEWFFWMSGLMLGFDRLFGEERTVAFLERPVAVPSTSAYGPGPAY